MYYNSIFSISFKI